MQGGVVAKRLLGDLRTFSKAACFIELIARRLPTATMMLNPIMVMIQVDVSGTVDDVIGGVEIGPRPEPGQGSPTETTGGGRSGGVGEFDWRYWKYRRLARPYRGVNGRRWRVYFAGKIAPVVQVPSPDCGAGRNVLTQIGEGAHILQF